MTDLKEGRAAEAGPKGLARLSAAELVAGYRAGTFTPREAIEDVIARLEEVDAACNAVVTPLYDEARAAADIAGKAYRDGSEPGPLAGVPVSVKDLVFVKGVVAKGGAPSLVDFVPEKDAHVVERLKAAGAIVTCKTTTCESGYKLTADSPVTGITRNPWSTDRTSGGSSGGAAAGVAGGGGPIAIGTDGVGSIRVPSSFCGVFGIKPTFGLVSRAPGFFPPSWGSLAHTGPIARTVGDAATMLEILAGYDVRDAASFPSGFSRARETTSLKGVKVGVSPDLGYAAVAPDVADAFEKAAATLASLGAEIIPVDLGVDPEILEKVLQPIAFSEQAASVGVRTDAAFAESDDDFRSVLAKGRTYSGVDYVNASHRRSQLRGRFVEVFNTVDLLVTPTVAVTAFGAGELGVSAVDGRPVDRHLGWSPFTWPINLAGLPAASIPCGFDGDGLPIGLQVIAPWLGEQRLVALAAAYEAAAPWAHYWPSL
ncbi:amidase [Acuticoccus kandeliae]|uniref:amidase n=1 Tax=Acuticoccus kandeliae TaxID=2073160 RepID=UPI000D3E6ECD|nr:amidase [Acuticoccus kandeliae]